MLQSHLERVCKNIESACGQQDDQGKFADLVPVILSSLFL